MKEGHFNFLIDIASKYKEEGNVRAQLEGIDKAVTKAGKNAPEVSARYEKLAESMQGLNFSPGQIRSIFSEVDAGNIKLTADQMNLLNQSLIKVGATQPQINGLMKSLDAKGMIPVKEMGDFEKALRRVMIVAPVWMAFRFILQSVGQLLREQVKFLIDLETAMAKIKIVGKGTVEEYDRLQTSLVALSVAYGSVASVALDAAVIFAQQGKTVSEVIALTTIAMKASQILGSDMKTTVDDLTAGVESFNIPVANSISIIDKWISVAKNFAVTSKDLADATKAAGATANQLGITINAFLGDVAAVVEVTRKSGSEAARGLQFIYARLLTTGAKTITQIAKIPIYLDKQNKATFALTNTYRSATSVLDDLASKWNGLANTEKMSIAASVASKRQLTIFMALMQNYNASLNARIIALDSAGAAEQAFGIIQETTKIKIDRLSASWNSLTTAVADTEGFKVSLDVLAELIGGWTRLLNTTQSIKAEGAKYRAEVQKGTDSQIAQINSLKELIELRNEYLNRPASDINTKILEKINSSIDRIRKNSSIPSAINIDTDDAVQKLELLIDDIAKFSIKQEVDLEIKTDKEVLEAQIKKITNELTSNTLSPIKVGLTLFRAPAKLAELKSAKEALIKLEEKQNKLIDERMSKYEVEKTPKTISDLEKELDGSTKLLDYEKDKISATEKLNRAKASGLYTNEQLLDLEIQMMDSLYEFNNIHERAIKKQELEEERVGAINKDIEERLKLQNSVLDYLGQESYLIIYQEMKTKALIQGEEYLKNSFEDRLKLAAGITKEIDEQEKKSSHIVELFKIYQKYGSAVANEISRYLGGELTAPQLSTSAMKALKKFSGGTFEEATAEKFFAQKAPGFVFPEEVERERKKIRNLEVLQSVLVEPMTINVNIDSEKITQKVKDAINKELDNVKSKMSLNIYGKIDDW